jgi:hypothetical protein
MIELVLIALAFAGGYVASLYSWPWLRTQATGAAAEIMSLRARARALEDSIRRAL